MTQKLDTFSKILLATQSINYMACSIQSVVDDMRVVNIVNKDRQEVEQFSKDVCLNIEKEHKEFLEEVLQKLSVIMEDMGNHINNHDAISAIDIRVTEDAFDIIIHGNDDVNEELSSREKEEETA